MNIKDVKIGTKLEVTIKNYEKTETEMIYVSQLEEVLGPDCIVISAPIYERNIIPISINTNIKVVFQNSKGLFTFRGVVQSRGKRENLLVLKVRITSNIIKIQRREYFRFEWMMPVRFRVLEDENRVYDEKEAPCFEAVTRDISGGGLALVTNKKQARGNIIEVELDIEEDRKITVSGVVVRSEIYERDETKFDIGVMFMNIPPRDRDLIIKFIFSMQSKLIQKGMV